MSPAWVEDARELPDREPPPGHGEHGYAGTPGSDPACWCGRPLGVRKGSYDTAARYRVCSVHGIQQVLTIGGWLPARKENDE